MQWCLTIVGVDNEWKISNVDMRFLPYNKRNATAITPIVRQRMAPGATITTDGWRAYPIVAANCGLVHNIVNHSVEFVSPAGHHTNHVEGVHGRIKQMARQQFSRLPKLTDEGLPLLLDILVWRRNMEITLSRGEMFRAFMATLTFLIQDGVEIEDYDFHVPMGNLADDDHQHQDGDDDEDDNEDDDENDDEDDDNDAGDDQQQQEEEDEDNVEHGEQIFDSDSSVVEDGVVIEWFVPSAEVEYSESE